MKIKERSLRPAAYHEAGHAVIRIATDLSFIDVKIRSDGTGFLQGSGALLQGYQALEADIISTMAGPLAEARIRKCAQLSVWFTGGACDLIDMQNRIEQLVAAIPVFSAAEYERQFERRTRSLLAAHWNAVCRVADVLTHRLALDYHQVRSIVDNCEVPA